MVSKPSKVNYVGKFGVEEQAAQSCSFAAQAVYTAQDSHSLYCVRRGRWTKSVVHVPGGKSMVFCHVSGNLGKASPFINVETMAYVFIGIPVVSHGAKFPLQSWLWTRSWRRFATAVEGATIVKSTRSHGAKRRKVPSLPRSPPPTKTDPPKQRQTGPLVTLP